MLIQRHLRSHLDVIFVPSSVLLLSRRWHHDFTRHQYSLLRDRQGTAAAETNAIGSNHPVSSSEEPTASSSSSSALALERELYDKAKAALRRPLLRGVVNFQRELEKQRTRTRDETLLSSSSSICSLCSCPRDHHGDDDGERSFVASAVLATPSACSCGAVCVCPPLLQFTGVNSALHRQINNIVVDGGSSSSSENKKSSNQNSNNSGGPVVRGLLKGCAEQNALGAFAASGNAFEQVRGIVICSIVVAPPPPPSPPSLISKKKKETTTTTTTTKSLPPQQQQHFCQHRHHRVFPCTACRNYLSKVRSFVASRHANQVLKLSCLSLHLGGGNNDSDAEKLLGGYRDSTAAVQMAEQQAKGNGNCGGRNSSSPSAVTQISVDCMPGWSSEFRQDVL